MAMITGIESAIPGGAEAVAMQLMELLTPGSVSEVAVTVMVIEIPIAPLGTITESVALPEAPAAMVSELDEISRIHPAPSDILRSNVSVPLPVLVTVTVYVRLSPITPLCEVGEIETLTPLAVVTDTCAVQLLEELTPVPFAVTVMLSIVPPDGTVTLRVALPLLPDDTVREVGEMLGDHLALSETIKE